MPLDPPASGPEPSDFAGDVGALAAAVNGWAAESGVFPVSGQASREVTVRNLRYYRSLALLDGPLEGGGYGPKHFHQVAAIRLLQARGLPLARIRDLLYGRSEEELEATFREGIDELHQPPSAPPFVSPGESCTMHGLAGGFALLAPFRSTVTADQLDAIARILNAAAPPTTREPKQQP